MNMEHPMKRLQHKESVRGITAAIFFAFFIVLTALSGGAGAATFILEGNVLRVGVSNTGGLIDDGFTVGIDYDKDGTTWTTYDFSNPALHSSSIQSA